MIRRPADQPHDPFTGGAPHGVELGDYATLLGDDWSGDDISDLLGGDHPDTQDLGDLRSQVPRIRPILVALAARSAGAGKVDRHVQNVAEILHLALAVHDLALGREGGRRRRVARRLLRRSVGWLGGNHLTLRALEIARHHAPPEVLGDLLDTLREVTDGQALCRNLQAGGIPTEDDWLEHADHTTGALFAFCCRAGGRLAGADEAVLSALGRCGRHLGRLWHVAEDVAAIRHGDGPSHLLGRALAARPVLPVILASDPAVGGLWGALVSDPRSDRAEDVVRRVWASGGLGACRAVLARESWAAQRALTALEPTPYRKAMERLAAALARS